ncbi:MAG: tRNA lysidine(34) synthetase TilS [Ignavibacteriales bacterium]|nr:MAG: tRNA lysidine(34) synthetase TilS [Ignavibacteriales bacterium]
MILMKSTEQKVLKFITEKKLIQENDKVLTGLSGGPDSVFLLHFLKKYSKKFKIEIGVVHINHLLRGKDADKDERFCREFSEKLNLLFFEIRKDIKASAAKEKISVEEAGRLIRYKVYQEILVKEGYNKIATAHNADENAETVLLNLIKGSGIQGLSGIPPLRENIIRPLLVLTKQEILNYLTHYKIKYRTDLTNFTDDAERNFLRNQVIPLINKRLNPSFSNTLFKSSEVFRNIYSVIKKKTDLESDKFISEKKGYLSLSLNEFQKIEDEYRSEVLRYIFLKKFGTQLSFNDCSKILLLVNKQTGKTVQISDYIKVTRERDELLIHKEKVKKEFNAVTLSCGESVRINDGILTIKEAKTINKKYSSDRNVEFISGDEIKNFFLVRRWLPGDRFYPLGMKGSKKVSDYLNEQKILSVKKREQMVLINEKRIVWILGLRLDERFKVTPGTKKVYQLCLS